MRSFLLVLLVAIVMNVMARESASVPSEDVRENKQGQAEDVDPLHRSRVTAAWKQSQWADIDPVPETVFSEYLLPQTSLGERSVEWFPVLRPIAETLTRGSATPLEAAMKLNRDLFKRVGVIYSTERDLPNQDPLHSIRIGKASCSGLSILLADACRAVAIPARLVGCQWRKKTGNHTWVEVWSRGEWHTLGAAEAVPSDQLWFLNDAAQAISTDPKFAIYATRRTFSGTVFYGWNVPADEITARYARKNESGAVTVYFAAEHKGKRVAVPFSINGTKYTTPGPEQDLNDYATVSFPSNVVFTIEIIGEKKTYHATPNALFIEQIP
ncbi:MAG: transglutaminase-like domain-containing protein [Kiritimatiellia bacterium]